MANRLISVWRFLTRRRQVERELDAELGYHVERLTEQNLAQGMRPAEARREAVLTLGGLEGTKVECREARGGRAVEAFFQDLRYGLRVVRKNKGFALAAILTLALGIGANTAIFSVVYGVLLRPLPYAQGARLVVLHQLVPGAHVDDMPFSVKEIADYTGQNHTLAAVAEHHSMNFLLLGKDSAQRVETAVVSANFFDVLGVRALRGRTFIASDDAPDGGDVLILSYEYWRNEQASDPNIIGKRFHMNNHPYTVIGVLPPIPQYPQDSDVYMVTSQCPYRSSASFKANRQARMMTVFARLKPGVTLEQAQADLSVVASRIANSHPDAYPKQEGYGVEVSGLREDLTRRAREMFLVLLAVAGFVLLIACANVANLMLARLMRLENELAVRAALGASRGRLVRHVLTESVLLSVLGGAAGVVLAPMALEVLLKFAGKFTPRAAEVRMDAPVLLFSLLVSVVAGVIFGLGPALSFGAWGADSLRQVSSRGTMSRGRHRLRAGLVVAQVAVSVVLLAGAGLMLRSFATLLRVYPGFRPAGLLSLRLSAPFPPYKMDNYLALATRIVTKTDSIPGVESAALGTSFPFDPDGVVYGPGANRYEIEGKPPAAGGVRPKADIRLVSSDYFQTIGQPILEGRAFTEKDWKELPGAVVINESMARHAFPNENPVGRRIRFDPGMGPTRWFPIVGVASDVKEFGLDRPAADEIYATAPDSFENRLIARTIGDPGGMGPEVRSAIRGIDPMIAIDRVQTVEGAEYASMESPRVMTLLLGIFAGLAVAISCSGIGAVMALAVSERTREIGIRVALGAEARSVAGMMVRQGLGLAAAGTAIGVAGAAVLTRMLAAFLYDTSPTDLATFAGVALLFLLVAGGACYLPARRATSIDPLVALRQE